jgi:hypothetical protein
MGTDGVLALAPIAATLRVRLLGAPNLPAGPLSSNRPVPTPYVPGRAPTSGRGTRPPRPARARVSWFGDGLYRLAEKELPIPDQMIVRAIAIT